MRISQLLGHLGLVLALAIPSSALAQDPPMYSPSVSYSVGSLVQDSTQNVYRAIVPVPANTPNTQPFKAYTYWELSTVRTAITLNIGTGQNFPSFKDAWYYLLQARIAPAGAVSIRFVTIGGAYDETFPTQWSLNHPFGSKITISGDVAANVRLHFPTSSGFYLNSGHVIAGISNLTMDSVATSGTSAIYAGENATIQSLDGIKFTGTWQNFVFADLGAVIEIIGTNNHWVNTSSGVLAVGILSSSGSIVRITGTGFSYYGASNPMSFGMYAISNGRIEATSCALSHCGIGAQASSGSSINIPGARISASVSDDLKSIGASNIFANGGVFTSTSVDSTSHIFGP